MVHLIKNKHDFILTFFVGLAFLYGILSFQHYSPSFHDFYIHTFVFFLCSVGLFLFFIKREVKLYTSQALWLVFLLIFIIQPIFNNLIYVDGLIFPIAIILLMLFLSLAVSNIELKDQFIKKMALILALGAILLQLTQFLHIFNVEKLIELMLIPRQKSRFSGNLFQPNQTAFVFVLGIISVMYYFCNKSVIKYFLIFLLSFGVAFTASRTGLLLLVLFVFVFNVFMNKLSGISFFKVKDFISSLLGFTFGVLIYPYFSVAGTVVARAASGLDEARLSLLHRVWLIICDHPVMGGGWKSFSGFGIEYFDRIKWFDSVDHSHFIFGQLLAEFGVFGLIVIFIFIGLLIKNIRVSSIKDAYVLVILMVILFYSFFEFPLWQLRYLIIFSIFLSLYDRGGKVICVINNYLLLSILLLLSFFSLYYSYQYKGVSYLYDRVLNNNKTIAEDKAILLDVNYVYGFGYFDDVIRYEIYSKYMKDLNLIVDIGDRLVRYTPSYYYLIKHATSLALIGNSYNSIYYFKASCNYAYGQYCTETKNYLKSLAERDPDHFEHIYIAVSKN